MSVTRFVDTLVGAAAKPRSAGYKIGVAIGGALLFLAGVPALLFLAGVAIEKHLLVDSWRWLEKAFSFVCLGIGLGFMTWSVLTQFIVGKGTPVPIAPPQRLIVTGPYRLCRNPMALGTSVYYLGLGVFFGSLSTGVLMFLLALIILTCYHKLIEERELLRRFGAEYEAYRTKTPFLLPRL